ncbi:MAG: NAD(P)/FAD-dependent oxidoreductase [Anaerolineaceae bacterium]|nr:NAD(P)/FAD-dependent oxidoreductase [Anaerolineaceae bacterium]
MKTIQSEPRIVIIGAGFGGLQAAQSLSNAPVQVLLIDRNNYHLFQPLLYQVATATLSDDDIAYPLRAILREQKNLEFLLANVKQIDLHSQKIITDTDEISYDYLILAPGSETNFYRNESLSQHSFGLKNLQDAHRIRQHLLLQFEKASREMNPDKRKALLTFVIAGGGPTGVEMAGAISELAQVVVKKDYPDLDFQEIRIVLLEATDKLVSHLQTDLSKNTVISLSRKGVEIMFGSKLVDYNGEIIRLDPFQTFPARTLIWTAGVRASGLMDLLGLSQAGQKRIRVLPTLQLPEFSSAYVIGDSAYVENSEGKALPMTAPVAMQQAKHAVRNILANIAGTPLKSFTFQDPGMMATIGRNQAVAQIGKFRFTGWIAWLIWLFVHLIQIIGFRNRLLVLFKWSWEYIFYDRTGRLLEHQAYIKRDINESNP